MAPLEDKTNLSVFFSRKKIEWGAYPNPSYVKSDSFLVKWELFAIPRFLVIDFPPKVSQGKPGMIRKSMTGVIHFMLLTQK